MLGVPLLREGETIGVIHACRAGSPIPSPKSRSRLLHTFADQAVIAIENARMFEEVQARTETLQSLELQTGTCDILKVIAPRRANCSRFSKMLVSATRICEANYGR